MRQRLTQVLPESIAKHITNPQVMFLRAQQAEDGQQHVKHSFGIKYSPTVLRGPVLSTAKSSS